MLRDRRQKILTLFLCVLFLLLSPLLMQTAYADTISKSDASTISSSDIQKEAIIVPTVTIKSKTLYKGYNSYTLKIKNRTKKARTTFKTDDKSIASINKSGTIKPISAGTTKIHVAIKQNGINYIYEITVTVKDPYFEITASTNGVHVGSSFTFQAKRYGMRDKIKWTVSDKKGKRAKIKVTGSTKCKLDAIAEGTVTVTASWKNQKYSFEVLMITGSGELYIVDKNTKPYQGKFMNYGTYNENTKDYYIIRSYLERLNIAGGGSIVFKEGTYSITNTLCIPSNTQLRLFDGVTISKSDNTGTTAISPTRSLFQLVSYTSAAKEGIYTKYNGEKNIKIIGEGNATINLNYLNTAAIVMAHNSNVHIQGITFLNMNTNHFIELDASKDVLIENNVFSGYIDSTTESKEAINLDTPDRETRGFNQYWTSYDGTPNLDILIQNNEFNNLECAIGTHKYTQNKMHTNIQIVGNSFTNIKRFAIQAMNWDSPNILNNTFDTVSPLVEDLPAILLKGVWNPTITENTFANLERIIEAVPWRNKGYGSIYEPIYNNITEENLDNMSRNYIKNVIYSEFYLYPNYDDLNELIFGTINEEYFLN